MTMIIGFSLLLLTGMVPTSDAVFFDGPEHQLPSPGIEKLLTHPEVSTIDVESGANYDIGGITCMDKKFYAISGNGMYFEVYDLESQTLATVPIDDSYSRVSDLVAFTSVKILMYTTFNPTYGVDVWFDISHYHSKIRNHFPLKQFPNAMSMTKRYTLLITPEVATGYDENSLFEYSLDGTLQNEIKLSSSVVEPQHAVQLSNGFYVVIHGLAPKQPHRLVLVDGSGQVLKSATGYQFNEPSHIAVTEDGSSIIVADTGNNRVAMFNSDLQFLGIINTPMVRPFRLHLDEEERKLFIAQRQATNVIVVSY